MDGAGGSDGDGGTHDHGCGGCGVALSICDGKEKVCESQIPGKDNEADRCGV